VAYTGGPQRTLSFTVPTGYISITNTLGTKPTELPGITTATGTQTGRINRNGVTSACGTPKTFPGTISGTHSFDSYSFTACQSFCVEVEIDGGAAASNLFGSAYSPAYDPTTISTNYAGDPGLSSNIQSFGIDATASTDYTIVVNDIAGNPLSTPAPANTYTVKIPSCAINCNANHLPLAVAHDVSVIAANTGGMADASIDNGSSDPDDDAITLTQAPAGPYAVGVTSVLLTVLDAKGATAQTTANVTVVNPGFDLAPTLPSVTTTAGGAAIEHITFTPNPGVAATLTLSCSNLPAKSACSFEPATVASGSAQTDVVLTVTTTASTAALARPPIFYAMWLPLSALSFIGMTVLGIPRRRRKAAAIVVTLVCGSWLGLLIGCGGGSSGSTTPPYNGTPKGTYTVTVRGTSGNLTETTTFSLTVN
jgi:hypothetical protein